MTGIPRGWSLTPVTWIDKSADMIATHPDHAPRIAANVHLLDGMLPDWEMFKPLDPSGLVPRERDK